MCEYLNSPFWANIGPQEVYPLSAEERSVGPDMHVVVRISPCYAHKAVPPRARALVYTEREE